MLREVSEEVIEGGSATTHDLGLLEVGLAVHLLDGIPLRGGIAGNDITIGVGAEDLELRDAIGDIVVAHASRSINHGDPARLVVVALRQILRRISGEIPLATTAPVVLEAGVLALADHAVAHDVSEPELGTHELGESILDGTRNGPDTHGLATLGSAHHVGLDVVLGGFGRQVLVEATEGVVLLPAVRAAVTRIATTALTLTRLTALAWLTTLTTLARLLAMTVSLAVIAGLVTLAVAGLVALALTLLVTGLLATLALLVLTLALLTIAGLLTLLALLPLLTFLARLLTLTLLGIGLARLGVEGELAASRAAARALLEMAHDFVVDRLGGTTVKRLVREDEDGLGNLGVAVDVLQEVLEAERLAEVAAEGLGAIGLAAALRLVVIIPDDGVHDIVDGPVPNPGVLAPDATGAMEEEVVEDLMVHDDARLPEIEGLEELGVPVEALAVRRGSLPSLDAGKLGLELMRLRHGDAVEEGVSSILRLLEHPGHHIVDLLFQRLEKTQVFDCPTRVGQTGGESVVRVRHRHPPERSTSGSLRLPVTIP